MPTATVNIKAILYDLNTFGPFIGVLSSDLGVTQSDGGIFPSNFDGMANQEQSGGFNFVLVSLDDTGAIPSDALVSSVEFIYKYGQADTGGVPPAFIHGTYRGLVAKILDAWAGWLGNNLVLIGPPNEDFGFLGSAQAMQSLGTLTQWSSGDLIFNPVSGLTWTRADLFNYAFGLRFAFASADVGANVQFSGIFSATVTYTAGSFSWTFSDSGTLKQVGDVIEIHNMIGFGLIAEVTFIFTVLGVVTTVKVKKSEFIFQSTSVVQLRIPFGLKDFEGTVEVDAVGDGVTFSGSVPLGTLNIFFENGSGIYTIVKNKITDTIYDVTIGEIGPVGISGIDVMNEPNYEENEENVYDISAQGLLVEPLEGSLGYFKPTGYYAEELESPYSIYYPPPLNSNPGLRTADLFEIPTPYARTGYFGG